jgi:hypothetical protein
VPPIAGRVVGVECTYRSGPARAWRTNWRAGSSGRCSGPLAATTSMPGSAGTCALDSAATCPRSSFALDALPPSTAPRSTTAARSPSRCIGVWPTWPTSAPQQAANDGSPIWDIRVRSRWTVPPPPMASRRWSRRCAATANQATATSQTSGGPWPTPCSSSSNSCAELRWTALLAEPPGLGPLRTRPLAPTPRPDLRLHHHPACLHLA